LILTNVARHAVPEVTFVDLKAIAQTKPAAGPTAAPIVASLLLTFEAPDSVRLIMRVLL
jgi:hypothetical protein